MTNKTIQYICTVCGAKKTQNTAFGRPEPGTCPRAKTSGRPHRWVKNKEIPTVTSVGGKTTASMDRYMVVGGKKIKF